MNSEAVLTQRIVLGIQGDIKTIAAATPEVLVRFYNLTSREVDLIWINQKGFGIRYAKLGKNRHIDIRTYEQHPWIFRESNTGLPLKGQIFYSSTESEDFSIYIPKRRVGNNLRIVCRTLVFIRLAQTKLSDFCLRQLFFTHLENATALEQLPLPLPILSYIKESISRIHSYRRYFSDPHYLSQHALPRATLDPVEALQEHVRDS